ncbi:MAG: alkaline phosphatase [Flavobacteriaceae bacterium]|nr:alkaline phosphatase [Flavobacteriaceae bacterium]
MKKFILFIVVLCVWSCKKNQDYPLLNELTSDFYSEEMKPFYHGVASGDPSQEAVIIWTRVTPEHKLPEIKVKWELSADSLFYNVIKSGSLKTSPERDYTVKVDVQGLEPNQFYYYRFEALDSQSIIGRTKTTPENSEDLHFAVASCSSVQWGYFNSYGRIAEEPVLDAVIHLGDYIYEHGKDGYGDTTIGRIHLPEHEILSLEDYRTRYAQYRLDSDLRNAHKNHPFISVWDDHEITNNAYADGAQNHQEDEGDYMTRREIARQVYYEWMPIREQKDLYRTISFGGQADLIMLDGRLAGRSKQADSLDDPIRTDEAHTMLGKDQFNWFNDQLRSSKARWKLIGNQVIFSYQDWGYSGFRLNMDSWDGYPREQESIADFIRKDSIKNVVFLTGDTHSAWAFEATNDPFESYDRDTGQGAIGVEFGVTSINSANSNERNPTDSVKVHESKIVNSKINPHLKYVNMRDHGYLKLTLNDSLGIAEFKIIGTTRQRDPEITVDKVVKVKSGSTKLIID